MNGGRTDSCGHCLIKNEEKINYRTEEFPHDG